MYLLFPEINIMKSWSYRPEVTPLRWPHQTPSFCGWRNEVQEVSYLKSTVRWSPGGRTKTPIQPNLLSTIKWDFKWKFHFINFFCGAALLSPTSLKQNQPTPSNPNRADEVATVTNSCRHSIPHAFHCVHWNRAVATGSSLPFPGPQDKRGVCSGGHYILSQPHRSMSPVRRPRSLSILFLSHDCFSGRDKTKGTNIY